MQFPIIAPAPLVIQHDEMFAESFKNRCQLEHVEQYLTGLMVLSNKTMANIARCTLASADKTNLSRFFSEAPWEQQPLNAKRIDYMLAQTAAHRRPLEDSAWVCDDTLCEHVGNLFEYVDRHYNHGDDTFPLAHNPVTSHFISGAVRFPLGLRLYRRYDEFTDWETFVQQQFPGLSIPRTTKERTALHKILDPALLTDPAFAARDAQFQTKIELAVELLDEALEQHVPFGVALFDGWYLAPDLLAALKTHRKDWVSLLKKNRRLETNSFVLKDAAGKALALQGPHIKIEELVPLIPPSAFRALTIGAQSYWCFTLSLRIPDLGKVRIVISFGNAELSGSYAVLVTNRVDWSAQRIIALYLQRWPIETFYQDGKTYLGFDEYRMRDAEAIKKHWCLEFAAYSILHLDCLPPSPRKGQRVPLKTIGEACRQQAQALIQQLLLHTHELLQQGQDAATVFTYLFAKQQLC